jgi:hypothetical protein
MIEATRRVKEPRTTPTTIAVIRELPVGALPVPLVVGTGVLVLELWGLVLVVDTTFDVEVGTKVLIGEKDGEGGV